MNEDVADTATERPHLVRAARRRRETVLMLIITLASATVIAIVLFLAGAFIPSTS